MSSAEEFGLHVKSLRDARKVVHLYDGLISIENYKAQKGLRITGSDPKQLVLKFDDVDHVDDTHKIVTDNDVRDALDFARDFVGRRLLVHCHAGRCRSTSIVLAILADRMGPGKEIEAVHALKAIRHNAAPNVLVMDIADRLLGRDGAIKRAWMAHGEKGYQIASVRLIKRSLQVTKQFMVL